jgi:hypothetical protein
MKLILHIGTHKTGTTALQQFLYANRQPLAAGGFYYATPPHGLHEANFVDNALKVGKTRVVHSFFRKHTELARRGGAHTILASAENFYAMSVLDAMQRREVCGTAVERDHTLIETLRALMPKGIETVHIACYFRRPDRYAESLYSQHVKRGIIFDGTFGEFFPIIKPALFYNEHMQAWSDVFDEGNCIVRLYEPVRGDIVSDFVQNVVGIGDLAQFAKMQHQANERVSRDVLEFKRLRNSTARINERDIERTILRLVDEEMQLRRSEPDHYQDFLSPYERAELLGLVQPEMQALRASHDVPSFPSFDLESAKASWRPYPGLGHQRRQEIELHYDRINGRFAFRLERLTLGSARFLRKNVPSGGVVLDVLRTFGAKHALRRWMRRIQLGSS